MYAGEQSKLHRCNISGGNRPPLLSQELCKMRGLDDDIWQLIECLWKQDPDVRLVAESARAFVGYKLQARNEMRSSLSGQDPEWDLGFLRRLSVAMSPFELRGPVAT